MSDLFSISMQRGSLKRNSMTIPYLLYWYCYMFDYEWSVVHLLEKVLFEAEIHEYSIPV
jgi:hypothetical protein